jgi:hypothetical protein
MMADHHHGGVHRSLSPFLLGRMIKRIVSATSYFKEVKSGIMEEIPPPGKTIWGKNNVLI